LPERSLLVVGDDPVLWAGLVQDRGRRGPDLADTGRDGVVLVQLCRLVLL